MGRPYIICHMIESVDGRIDCDMVEQISGEEYDVALEELECDAMLNGRQTAVLHYAEKEPYVPTETECVGNTTFYRAEENNGWHIIADSRGTLRWSGNKIEDRPLLVLVSEQVSREYLDYLTGLNISYICSGESRVDLAQAMELLHTQFGVQRLVVTGGGTINGALLEVNLLDEVSIQIAPGIDGRRGWTASFDGIKDQERPATKLSLVSVKQQGETVWMRYKVNKDN